jgi:predicted dehydrogenase
VTNRTRAKAEDYAQRHGVPMVYGDIDEMLADTNIDAVYIATPPASHKELAIKCAKAKKPCYIEKPIAVSHQECLDMIRAFEENETKAFAAYYRRRLPRFLKAKELLDSGAIGELRYVRLELYRPASEIERDNTSWRVHQSESGGGIFMDVAVHTLDAIDFIVGEITEVKSFVGNQAGYYEVEDVVNMVFSFANGVKGSGDWCFTTGVEEDIIKLVGSEGNIEFACFGTGPVVLRKAEGVREFPEPTPEHIQMPLIQSIVDELNGTDTCPSTLYSAARTAWVCDRVYGK